MINREDFLALNYYKKTPFYGSCGNLHYRISRVEEEVPEGEEPKVSLKLVYWPGPYTLEKTDEELRQTADFEYSNDGLTAIAEFLNGLFETKPELWKAETEPLKV